MDVVPLLGAVGCGAAGAVVLALAAWFRWGRSRVARWWVRRAPVHPRMSHTQGASEALALGFVPYLGQLSLWVGAVLLLGVHPVTQDLLVPAAGVLAAIQFVALVVLAALVANRRVLALFLYPGWLRPQRREDRAHLLAMARRR